jgi:hypothetical protein
VTLTIQGGVDVQFKVEHYTKFFVSGRLSAIGTAAHPIRFRSSQAAERMGAPGQYGGISVSGTAEFSFAQFEYGGSGSGGYYAYGELTNLAGTIKVENSTFQHNEYSGLEISSSAISTEVSHSTFTDNGDGISRFESGPFTLKHSWIIENKEWGLFFNFIEKTTSPGALIENNEIRGNGNSGILVEGYCHTPTSAFPHGNRNDIFGNGKGTEPSDGSDIASLYGCEALHVDWSGNYWGGAEFLGEPHPLLLKGYICEGTWPKEWYEGASFQPAYLAFAGFPLEGLKPPPGPITTSSYTTLEPHVCPDGTLQTYYMKHIYNAFYLQPGEISQEKIPIE